MIDGTDDDQPPGWLVLLWVAALGAIMGGVGAAISWLLYGDTDPYSHCATTVITLLLTLVAVLAADETLAYVLAWLSGRGRHR